MSEQATATTYDPQVFRDVVGRFATGVTVITTTHDGVEYGMTASAMTSLSVEPPMVLVCVNHTSATREAVSRSGVFGVNILHEDQADVAMHFASSRTDKFTGVRYEREELGTLRLDGVLAWLECEVVEDVTGGTHSVFFGKVRSTIGREGRPLAYWRGAFGGLVSRTDPVVAALREQLLVQADTGPLDIVALASALGSEPSEVRRALATLSSSGLVKYDLDRGFLPVPLRVDTVLGLIDARTAIETGGLSLALTSGRRTPAELAGDVQAALHQAKLSVTDDAFDARAYVRATSVLHEALVAATGSQELLDAHRRLALPAVLVRVLDGAAEAPIVLEEHGDLVVEALASGNVEQARQAVETLGEATKEAIADALQQSSAG